MATATFLAAALIISILATTCGDYPSFKAMAKEAFMPRSWGQFFFPRCPMCWMARIFVVAAVAVNFGGPSV